MSIASNGQHLVVVVAHPDDETFGCGSLIADSSANAAQVTVICATRGEGGARVADPTTDHLSLGEVREQELRAAAVVRRWVAEMQALRPDAPYLGLDLDGLGTPDSQLTSIDVSRYVAQREQAIACHRSQTSPFEGLSAELRRAFLSTDFVQYVTP